MCVPVPVCTCVCACARVCVCAYISDYYSDHSMRVRGCSAKIGLLVTEQITKIIYLGIKVK